MIESTNDWIILNSDYLFKVLMIGNSGVGKSCLLLRFAVSAKYSQTRRIRNSECLLFNVDYRTTNSRKTSCQLSVSTSRSVPSTSMRRSASCRFGTLLVKSDSRPSRRATTRELTASLLSTTLRTVTHSMRYTPGWAKLRSTPRTTSRGFWSETRPISRTEEQSHSKKARRWLIITECASLRLQPRSAEMSRLPSQLWLARSRTMWPRLNQHARRPAPTKVHRPWPKASRLLHQTRRDAAELGHRR